CCGLSCRSTEQNELRRVAASVNEVRKGSRCCRRCACFKCRRRRGNQVISAFVVPLTQSNHRHCTRGRRYTQHTLERLRKAGKEIAEVADDLTGRRNGAARAYSSGCACERSQFESHACRRIRRIRNSDATQNYGRG